MRDRDGGGGGGGEEESQRPVESNALGYQERWKVGRGHIRAV